MATDVDRGLQLMSLHKHVHAIMHTYILHGYACQNVQESGGSISATKF